MGATKSYNKVDVIKRKMNILVMSVIVIFNGVAFLLYKCPAKDRDTIMYGDVSFKDVFVVAINSIWMVGPTMITLAGDMSDHVTRRLTYIIEGPSCGDSPPLIPFCDVKSQWMTGSDGYIEEDWATYKPKYGYSIVDNDKAICNEKGEWIHVPKCVPISCGRHPPYVENCEIKSTKKSELGSFVINDTVTFAAQSGHKLVGNEQALCSETGQWENLPTCKQITCGSQPTQIPNCHLSEQKNSGDIFLPQDFAVYGGSNDNYKVVGNSKVVCDSDGKFSDGPVCILKEVCNIKVPQIAFGHRRTHVNLANCPHLAVLEGTNVHCPCNKVSRKSFHGTGLTFSCPGGTGGNPNMNGNCGRSCFHGENKVYEVSSQKMKYLKDIKVGEKVLAMDKTANKVVVTAVTSIHQLAEESSTFYRFTLKSGQKLHGLTADHLIPVLDPDTKAIHDIAAKDLKVGHMVKAIFKKQLIESLVESVDSFEDTGVYTIETEHDNLFVDDINVSTQSKNAESIA